MPSKPDRLKSPNWHFPQLALPQLALPQTGPRPRLKSSNCRYTDHNEILELNYLKRSFEIIFYTIKIEFFPSILPFYTILKITFVTYVDSLHVTLKSQYFSTSSLCTNIMKISKSYLFVISSFILIISLKRKCHTIYSNKK